MLHLKTGLRLICIFLFTLSPLCLASYHEALLVVDMRNIPALPKHFRASSDPLPAGMNGSGLADLHIAGGAQFSRLALFKILERLQLKHLTIIDLRQESHGFLNGNAISWYAPADAANAGLSDSQIERVQQQLLNALGRQEFAKVNLILDKTDSGRINQTKLIEFSVHSVSSEEELANELHLGYYRVYVQDYHAPTPKQVDRFIQIVKQLPPEQWIYFHCRAGIGRTTTFMAMYDMMRNAKKVSLADILARQTGIGGKDLTELPDQHAYKFQSASERLDFLKKFYQYAHDNHDHFDTSWSRWNKHSTH